MPRQILSSVSISRSWISIVHIKTTRIRFFLLALMHIGSARPKRGRKFSTMKCEGSSIIVTRHREPRSSEVVLGGLRGTLERQSSDLCGSPRGWKGYRYHLLTFRKFPFASAASSRRKQDR